MPTTQKVSDIIEKVRKKLSDAKRQGIYLKVEGDRLDDGWLYIVVVPAKAGVRASDHAALMARIERELRDEGNDQVLLVPALEE